jgi:hypothetical protein
VAFESTTTTEDAMPLENLASTLRAHVERLAATPREPGTEAHRQARTYIRAHLERAGFTVRDSVHDFQGGLCHSLLTEPLPADPALPLVVIGAHYDTVTGSPGADDNASAVAALLELAAWLGPRLGEAGPWHARVQLAAYDLEEYGLIGSYLHSGEIQAQGIALRGMISLEMLGYTDHRPKSQRLPPMVAHLYPNVANFIGVLGTEASAGLLKVVVGAMKTIPGLPVEFLAVPGDGRILPETRLSDHSSFWDRGYPALMLTDTSFLRNPHYHQTSDTPDTLDYPFLARVTEGVRQAGLHLLRLERLPT